jgi:DNA mismatch repair protein MutS
LRNLVDLEKIGRQIIARKVVPSSLYRLYQSLLDIQQIHVCLFEYDDFCSYLFGDGGEGDTGVHAKIEASIVFLLEKIYSTLIVEECASMNSLKIERNIIKKGVSAELDELLETYTELESAFSSIKITLNRMIAPNDETEFIRIHETEKMGQSLQITKTRGAALRKILGNSAGGIVYFSLGKNLSNKVAATDIKFKAAGGTYEEIEFPLLVDILYKKSATYSQIQNAITREYARFIESMEIETLLHLESISRYIAKLDVIQSKTYVAAKFNYCRPRLVSAQDHPQHENDAKVSQSFFAAKKMRHCLIEHIQTNETYVANDVSMGASGAPNGILLYGTNAVGKTSLIRAIGICIIMAQAGMYVPCAEFTYYPYNAIYTRILGNDNMFKNLSTFAVEMSELRVILNNADSQSLVLGDELCSGTETESALSIFMAGLTTLSRLGASFIFATHFHEIAKFEELKNLSNVVSKHMSVYYDREHDCLVYDRILKDGAGDKMYGLEVAKSLHLPDDFIEMAYAIRTKYFPVGGELSGVATRYNAKKIRSVCELCGEMATETHHILEQANADARGYVDGIHKNHPANLVGLCERCHDLQHHGVAVVAATNPATPSIAIKIKKKTTAGYKRI